MVLNPPHVLNKVRSVPETKSQEPSQDPDLPGWRPAAAWPSLLPDPSVIIQNLAGPSHSEKRNCHQLLNVSQSEGLLRKYLSASQLILLQSLEGIQELEKPESHPILDVYFEAVSRLWRRT